MQAKIEALETRVAFQEDAIADLNREMSAHWQTILELKTQLRHLHERLSQLLEDNDRTDTDDAPPPHY